MTPAEFIEAQKPCVITTVQQMAARTMLEVAQTRVRRARVAPMSVQVMEVCRRDNALAIAQEWGVA